MAKNKTDPEQIGYSKGYAAGQRRLKAEKQEAHDAGRQAGIKEGGWKPIPVHIQRHDAMMSQSLNMVLEHCRNWSIGDKKIRDAEGYVTLAKVFVGEQIKVSPKL